MTTVILGSRPRFAFLPRCGVAPVVPGPVATFVILQVESNQKFSVTREPGSARAVPFSCGRTKRTVGGTFASRRRPTAKTGLCRRQGNGHGDD